MDYNGQKGTENIIIIIAHILRVYKNYLPDNRCVTDLNLPDQSNNSSDFYICCNPLQDVKRLSCMKSEEFPLSVATWPLSTPSLYPLEVTIVITVLARWFISSLTSSHLITAQCCCPSFLSSLHTDSLSTDLHFSLLFALLSLSLSFGCLKCCKLRK